MKKRRDRGFTSELCLARLYDYAYRVCELLT